MNHFCTSASDGRTLTLDAKSADRLQAEKDFGVRKPLNPAEQQSLNKLEVQIAESKLAQLHNQKHGNAAAQAQKARAENLFSENVHRSPK